MSWDWACAFYGMKSEQSQVSKAYFRFSDNFFVYEKCCGQAETRSWTVLFMFCRSTNCHPLSPESDKWTLVKLQLSQKPLMSFLVRVESFHTVRFSTSCFVCLFPQFLRIWNGFARGIWLWSGFSIGCHFLGWCSLSNIHGLILL